MKKYIHFLLTAATGTLLFTAAAAQNILVQDNFTDRSKFIDNTLLLNWGVYSSPETGLALQSKTDATTPTPITYNSICLTDSAVKHSGYTASNSLKTLTSIDYQFPAILDRNAGDIKVEFDAIWNSLDNGGESGRIVATLMGDFPNGGAQFDQVYDTSLADPFGKPLYNIRLRNTSGANGPLMLYGAGNSTNPEWEIYGTAPGWWLPGFSVQSGGGAPGSGPDYPASGTKKSSIQAASASVWRHYTWVIKPERLELYYRNSSQPASSDVLIFFMQTPSSTVPATQLAQINTAHSTSATQLPPFYKYHNFFSGLRIYWRGVVNAFVANLKVTYNGTLSYQNMQLQKPVSQRNGLLLSGTLLPAQPVSHTVSLQHSTHGINFTTIQNIIIPAGETRVQILHNNPAKGINYYRLLQQTRGGQNSYSNIVQFDNSPAAQISWSKQGQAVLLRIPAAYQGQQLTIMDAAGSVLQQQKITGSNVLIAAPASGVLIYRVGDKAGRIVL